MRIALDVMGSDGAPTVDVAGAVRAARRFGEEIVLVGKRDQIERELAKHATKGLPLSVVPASQVVGMDQHPSRAVRNKEDASIVVAMKLVRDGAADALVSAGNSGGVLAASLISAGRLGRISGIDRPAISTIIPTLEGTSFILDIGANADCRPEWLVQFAVMGAAYVRQVMGVENPRIALLSNGEEQIKGNKLVQEAHELLSHLKLNTIGNVEGKDIPAGLADVIVSDGFVGNIAIKTAEGISSMLLTLLRQEIKKRPLASFGAFLAKPAFRAVASTLDYREFGGAPLLGVNGVVIIAHGRSDAIAIENAVRVAIESVQRHLVDEIRNDIGAMLKQVED